MKALIIDRFPENFLDQMHQRLGKVEYFPDRNRAEILAKLPDVDILVMNSRIQLDREAIDVAENLKLVVRAGVGMDHIDSAYLKEKGIRVENTKGGNADAVGEHTVGMLLNMRHHLHQANDEVKNFHWNREPNRGWEIGGKTIGLIGYGFTGKSVAKKLSGFGCHVLAYDKYLHNYSDSYAKEATMDELFREAEIVSLHVPLTNETRSLANRLFFESFHRSIHFLNLARGPIVNVADLLKALDKGSVLAASLDVLPNEKLDQLSTEETEQYKDLFSRKNVFLSPHVGGWTHESLENINQKILSFVDEVLHTPI